MSEPEPVIDIRDPEIDVQAVMERIRARVQQRRAEAQARGLDYERLAAETPGPSGPGRLPAEVYYDLYQLRSTADSLFVSVNVRDQKLPLVNRWVMKVKEAFHVLVVIYVNMLAGRQVTFNTAAAHVIAGLAQALEDTQARVEALEREVAALRGDKPAADGE